MISNSFLLILHVSLVGGLTLGALRLGKEAMIAWLSLLAVALNFFVLKQTTLFGCQVTCSDALAVGYLLGLNLIQEFFGQKIARKTIWISFYISLSFVILSQIHLTYQPNSFDLTQRHFVALLHPMPRIIAASFTSFLLVQCLDLWFFNFLRSKTRGKYLTLRATIALICSQTLDTLLFSFLGLYGLIANIHDVIFFSLIVKGIVIFASAPFVFLSKKVIRYEPISL